MKEIVIKTMYSTSLESISVLCWRQGNSTWEICSPQL